MPPSAQVSLDDLPPSAVGEGGGIVCLAFNTGPRDAGRLHALQRLYGTTYHVVAVSEKPPNEGETYSYEYRQGSLSSSARSRTRGQVRLLTRDTTCVMLDWFWLQATYYEDPLRYGMRWVDTHVPRAFDACPHLTSYILPLGKRGIGSEGLHVMLKDPAAQAALVRKGIAYTIIPWAVARAWHPLVRATDAFVAHGGMSAAAEVSERRFVDARESFVVFFRHHHGSG